MSLKLCNCKNVNLLFKGQTACEIDANTHKIMILLW